MTSTAPSRSGILKSDYTVPLPDKDICSLLFPRWQKWLDREAFECVTTGRKMTYKELRDSALRWGAELKKMVGDLLNGAPPRVTIFSQNVIEFGAIVVGILATGCTLTTVDPSYEVDEVMHLLKEVKPKVLIIHPSREDIADVALKRLGMSIPVMSIGPSKKGKTNIQDILNNASKPKIEAQRIDPSNPAIILFSGATTGIAKGVVHTHSSVTSNIVCMSDPRIFPYGAEGSPPETITGLPPFYHIYGLHIIILINLYLGSKILVFKEYDPKEYGNIIQRYKVQFLHLVPTFLNHIIKSREVTKEHLKNVKGVIIAASTVSPTAAYAFRDMTSQDVIFQEGFGMTEILGTHITPKDSVRIGFCGKLIPNFEAKVIDIDTHEVIGPNQLGELLLRGPSMMSHYLNRPDLTNETIDENGWLHTGDVVTYTEDGYFSIVDRRKDMIKVNSHKVFPATIEDVLMKHEGVAEAGVIGVPDATCGERPRAYVVKRKDTVTEEELVKHVERHLDSQNWLTAGVCFIAKLPKSRAGKPLRHKLRKLALESITKS